MRLKQSCKPLFKPFCTMIPSPNQYAAKPNEYAGFTENRRVLGACDRRIKRWVPAILLSAALAACGGGGGGSPAETPQPVPVAPPIVVTPTVPACTPIQTVKIQLFGDSTGGGTRGELQANMDTRFGTVAVQIEARAVSGTTGWQLLSGTDGLNKPWPQSVNADIVVVNHGINDLYQNEPVDVYADILSQLAVAPAIVVFDTPLLAKSGRPDLADTMRQVAKQKNIPLIDANAFQKSTPDWFSRYVFDDIHPNPLGFALLANSVMYPVLMPIVAKLKCQ